MLEIFPGANANNLPSYQEIASTEHPYVYASIQELMRIALTSPTWTRRTTQDTMVLGHKIPRGIDIFGAISVQSWEDMEDFEIKPEIRSPSSKPRETGKWERATKGLFQPERWLDENGNYNAYAGPMLPFGAGTRGCFGRNFLCFCPSLDWDDTNFRAGQRLARLELRMMIIMLVLSFEFKAVPEALASFRAEEVITRGPVVTYIRPIVRS